MDISKKTIESKYYRAQRPSNGGNDATTKNYSEKSGNSGNTPDIKVDVCLTDREIPDQASKVGQAVFEQHLHVF